jgi:hypothetical protein
LTGSDVTETQLGAARRPSLQSRAMVIIMQRTLIVLGVIAVAVGLLWPWIQQLGLGRLPGDIVIERENFRFYFPITTMIIVSAVVSLLLWLFNR